MRSGLFSSGSQPRDQSADLDQEIKIFNIVHDMYCSHLDPTSYYELRVATLEEKLPGWIDKSYKQDRKKLIEAMREIKEDIINNYKEADFAKRKQKFLEIKNQFITSVNTFINKVDDFFGFDANAKMYYEDQNKFWSTFLDKKVKGNFTLVSLNQLLNNAEVRIFNTKVSDPYAPTSKKPGVKI